jgi:hypothetical protein
MEVRVGQLVEVLRLSGDEKFDRDMRAALCYQDMFLMCLLLSLKKYEAGDKTLQATEDWRYWNRK